MIGIGTAPLQTLKVAEKVNVQGDGTVTVSFLDGAVMSVNPQGGVETRPAGTAGPWEKATIDGDVLVYRPDDQHVYCFAYVPKVIG